MDNQANRVDVDNGYVDLVNHMGDDLAVVNATRVSFGKNKEVFDEKDAKLIGFLAEHKHMSPFRHVQFTFRIHTSEQTMRQFYKHQVGCGWTSEGARFEATAWNEISGRYVEYPNEFHIPESYRKQHPTNKQASLPDQLVDNQPEAKAVYEQAMNQAYASYKQLLALGVCKEQARMVLPTSMMTTVIWTASLEAVVNFIRLRNHADAQLEIQKLANAVQTLIEPICSVSVKALMLQLHR